MSRNKDFFFQLLKRSTNLSHLAQIHAQIIFNDLQSSITLATKLTHRICDFNAVSYARDLFLSIPNPDLFLFNVVIRGFSKNESPNSSISLFTHLRKFTDLKPDKFTYAYAVSAASGLQDDRVGRVLHGQAIVDGCGFDLFVGSAFVDFYFKFWRVGYARKVFEGMSHKDTVSWNTMVSGYANNNMFDDSIRTFKDLVSSDKTGLDSTSLAAVLPAVAELQELRVGIQIQCLTMKLGCHYNDHVLTSFISFYSKCGKIDSANAVFRDLSTPDVIAYNALISGCTSNGETEISLKLFKELLVSGEKINSSTFVGLIPVFSPLGCLSLTYCIHCFCLKSGFVSHTSVSTALTTVYSRTNDIESARKLFDESLDKSLAAWNAMISGYTQNGLTEEAISLFREMQGSEVRPNPVTVTCIVSACAQLGTLSLGKWVHSLLKSNNIESNVYVTTALIDMYAKCGSITEARQLFDLTLDKNVVTWNAMISGYGLHGLGQEALKIFSEMLDSRVSPTRVTFLCLLYSCSHSGLVKEGEDIFRSMIHTHGLDPSPEHYACMVDIFGRAGRLEAALKFIEEMPVEPDSLVWASLLSSCMIHKNANLARVASEKLFELDPENVGYHVLLSNIYSAERNYSQAASIRNAVKKRNLAKSPGCTLIELGETPHVFTAGDQSHLQAKEINAMLEKLEGKMKEAGYIPVSETALHDVEEEERELMVKVHSEKLAIAFGILSTEPGTEIRIFKNLRVCLDCHSWTKFVSKVSKRAIVVRDANRFHHFQDGVCSCRDYW